MLGPLDPEICFLDVFYVGVTFCFRFVLHMFQFWFTFQLQFQLPAQDLWLLPEGPAGVVLPTWHLPTCKVEKRIAAFWIMGLLLAMQHGFTSHQCTCLGTDANHGVTAFDMGLLPLTWGYYFSHEATSCLT